ncbi:MAG: lysophospholipase [Bacteroidota bacterium]|nr:lysophospholipase [Bacteroidota bacterium]
MLLLSFMNPEKKHTMLCLGDSYTIGESVAESERFPVQAVDLLKKDGITIDNPIIIAKTGWTTDELAAAIKDKNLTGKYDYVTLLIGVNNQYRGRDAEEYRKEFDALLKTALNYANGQAAHVFVVSIPDWGATPFGAKDSHRTPEQIGKEIDHYNAINKEESLKAKVNYIDITPISRKAKQDPELVAGDGLHPSGKMYTEWAKLLRVAIKSHLE